MIQGARKRGDVRCEMRRVMLIPLVVVCLNTTMDL